ALDTLPRLQIADDPASQQAGDLLEADGVELVLDRDESLLVVYRGLGLERVQEVALAILDEADDTFRRHTVHVHIKHVEEDGHANTAAGGGFDQVGLFDIAVRRRNDDAGPLRDGARGVAKKPEEESRKQNRNYGQRYNLRLEPDDNCDD